MTLPTFTDGTVVPVASLNSLSSGVTNLASLLTGISTRRNIIPVASAYINATQSIPNATDTIVSFYGFTVDEDYIWVPGQQFLYINTAGNYVVWTQANFVYNATGIRAAHILLNGTSVSTNAVASGAGNASVTTNSGTAFPAMSPPMTLAVGAELYLSVFQNSGAALNIQSLQSGTFICILRIGN